MRSVLDSIWQRMPSVKFPELGKPVDVPVYIIHNSSDPEDYFFIFDFEQFVERSRGDIFLRPRLKVWAGRNDFSRRRFGRQFRESFSKEFDAARHALNASKSDDRGWFGSFLEMGLGVAASTVPGLIALVVLAIATAAGNAIWSALPSRPRLRSRKSDEEILEKSIAETQSKVDQALAAMDVRLHPELYAHAYRSGSPVSKSGMEDAVWPLPKFVSDHLNNKTSTSWW